jgi:alcohol dehydrogenase (NADP+)
MTCGNCKNQQENYCPVSRKIGSVSALNFEILVLTSPQNSVDTYGVPYGPKGTISQGGYASHIRAHQYFAFPIPDNIPTELAAPMMCAGITVYSPLVRLGCGPGKKVAIIGVYATQVFKPSSR